MFIKRFFGFFALILALAGCAPQQTDWYSQYGTLPTSQPSEMQTNLYHPEYEEYGTPENLYTYTPSGETKDVAVLLPLSGPSAELGKGISTSIEMAFLQRNYNNVAVTFYDMSGNRTEKQNIISGVLATEPDIIIGPIFAEDARLVRDMKPEELPVLTFSSDTSALGNGVMTMALVPAQSVEAIIKEMIKDNAQSVVVFAPKTSSGERMAGAAVQATNLYDMPLSGLFYYTEGDTDSIKQASQKAAMHTARTAANTKAREILSDIMIKEAITDAQKVSLETQLEKISKSDTLGKVPYDAILFLGNASDTKTIASFLRYFDVAPRDARFYGTALWASSELLKDFTMSGAKFAALPPMSPVFAHLYELTSGRAPSRLDTFGYDAANLAIGMLHSNKNEIAYLLDPSGYNGIDGLFRLKPTGESERALQIVETNGSGTARLNKPAAKDFLTPLYTVQQRQISKASEMPLVGPGVNPMDFITIPADLEYKYRTKPFGANLKINNTPIHSEEVIILPEDDSDIITSDEFQPVALEQIDRKLIDSVEVSQ